MATVLLCHFTGPGIGSRRIPRTLGRMVINLLQYRRISYADVAWWGYYPQIDFGMRLSLLAEFGIPVVLATAVSAVIVLREFKLLRSKCMIGCGCALDTGVVKWPSKL